MADDTPQAFAPPAPNLTDMSAFAPQNPYGIGTAQVTPGDVSSQDWTVMAQQQRQQQFGGTEPLIPSVAAAPGTVGGAAGRAAIDSSKVDPVAQARAAADAAEVQGAKEEAGAMAEAAKKESALAETTGASLTAQTADSIARINAMSADLERRSAEREKTDQQIEATQMAKAERLKTYEAQVTEWVHNTPTRQAAAATAMHLAGPISLLTAIGGAMTRQSGIAMLGALNGVVSGVQEGAENQFNDAMDKWNASYKAMMEKEQLQEKIYDTFLEAYKGRADAQDKAIERTRAVTNDRLQANQLQMGTDTQIFNMKKGVIDAIAQRNIAMAKVREAYAAVKARQQAQAAMDQDAIHVAALQYLYQGAKLNDIAPASRGGEYKAAIVSEATKIFEQDHANDEKYAGPNGHRAMLNDIAELETRARMELTGEAQRLRSANVMMARVQWAEGEIERLAPLAKAINHKVMGRIGFLPFNQLWEQGLTTIQDPDMAQFASITNTIMNAYNVLSARGGTDMNVRERNLSMLSTTSDPEVYDSKLDIMLNEIQTAKMAGLDTTRLQSYRIPLPGEDSVLQYDPTTNQYRPGRGYNRDLPAPWIPLETDPTAGGAGGAPSAGWGRATVQ